MRRSSLALVATCLSALLGISGTLLPAHAQDRVPNGILFMEFQTWHSTGEQRPAVALKSVRTTEGRLKVVPGSLPSFGDRVVELLDQQGRVVASAVHPDPLNVDLETVDAEGKLQHVRVPKEEATFFVRFQDHADASVVSVSMVMSDGTRERLYQQRFRP